MSEKSNCKSIENIGAEGGSRTHTTLRSTDFKSVASAISPPRRRISDKITCSFVFTLALRCQLPERERQQVKPTRAGVRSPTNRGPQARSSPGVVDREGNHGKTVSMENRIWLASSRCVQASVALPKSG